MEAFKAQLRGMPAAALGSLPDAAAAAVPSEPEEPSLSLEECRALEKERCVIGLRVRARFCHRVKSESRF